MLKTLTIEEYCNKLSSDQTTPGGGSSLANIALNAISLLEMSVAVTIKKQKKTNISFNEAILEAQKILVEAHKQCLELIDTDAVMFKNILAEGKNARLTGDDKALQQCYIDSANSCLALTELCVSSHKLTKIIIDFSDKYVVSDALIGKDILAQVAKSSAINVSINTAYIKDKAIANAIDEKQNQLTANLN